MAPRESPGPIALAAAVVGGIALLVVVAVVASRRPPEGPVAVDWDGVRCARCGMLVSDPAFAGQIHLEDGRVLHFDDPGCLLVDLGEREPARVRAAWLHHHREEDWLRLEEAAFLPVPHSPMGYGLGVVGAGEADAAGLDPEEARRRVRTHDSRPEAPR